MPRTSFRAAAAEVAQRDSVMAAFMERIGRFRLPPPTTDHFAALAESILYQQLAGAAAAAIHRRFVALFDGDLSPQAVLALPEKGLRGAGLSGSKAASIRDLAAKVADDTVPLERIERLSDDDIVTRLSIVRGIGRWTAEMFLIFKLPELLKPKQLFAEGDRFRPYRTVAAWYCWEAVDESRAAAKAAPDRAAR